MMISQNGNEPLASIVYPQLLGLCMGIDEKSLGIHMNQTDLTGSLSFINIRSRKCQMKKQER